MFFAIRRSTIATILSAAPEMFPDMSNGYEGPQGPPSTAWLLLQDYNLNKHYRTKYEKWDCPDDVEMLQLSNTRTPMCVLVKYEPE